MLNTCVVNITMLNTYVFNIAMSNTHVFSIAKLNTCVFNIAMLNAHVFNIAMIITCSPDWVVMGASLAVFPAWPRRVKHPDVYTMYAEHNYAKHMC